jgi:hypothetical protein
MTRRAHCSAHWGLPSAYSKHPRCSSVASMASVASRERKCHHTCVLRRLPPSAPTGPATPPHRCHQSRRCYLMTQATNPSPSPPAARRPCAARPRPRRRRHRWSRCRRRRCPKTFRGPASWPVEREKLGQGRVAEPSVGPTSAQQLSLCVGMRCTGLAVTRRVQLFAFVCPALALTF